MRASAIAVVVLLGCGGPPRTPLVAPTAAKPLPPTELALRGGGTWTSSGAAGKVVVLDVWATYCKPCKRAFPKLGRLAAQFPGAVVIGVSVDHDDAVVDRYLAETPAAFTIARDPGEHVQSGPLGVTQLPTLIVVDKAGRVRLRADKADEHVYDELSSVVTQLEAE